MRSYSELMQPLEEASAGRAAHKKIEWSDSLLAAFRRSQDQLKSARTLTIPRKEDQLQIITDASGTGIAAALYVLRGGKI